MGDRYVTTAVIRSKPLTVKPQGRIHTIAVEKIYPGFAVVMVDDSFRARLEPSAYNGPRDLIKEGKEIQGESDNNKDGKEQQQSLYTTWWRHRYNHTLSDAMHLRTTGSSIFSGPNAYYCRGEIGQRVASYPF